MILFGTLGPACANANILSAMLEAGMGGLRVNLSHSSLDQQAPLLQKAAWLARKRGQDLLLLADLQGPELRVGAQGLPLELVEGEQAPLSALCLPEAALPPLLPNQQLLLDDGRLCLTVLSDNLCRVERGGKLLPRKSLALPGLKLHLPPLTKSDLDNLDQVASLGIGGIMQPFVQSREDLLAVRQALDQRGGEKIKLFAKVENRQGLETLPQWIDLADWVVIARGDLGNSIPSAALPGAQKEIAALCAVVGKPFLVATQLLHTMEHTKIPTRAEISDVFNGVLDGASGLMLTGETAAGKYPVQAITALREISEEAGRFLQNRKENTPLWIISK